MTHKTYKKHIILSSILTAMAVCLIAVFCFAMFGKYSLPNESNTYLARGIVEEVYYNLPRTREVGITMSNGETLILTAPYTINNLFSTIGYDDSELSDILEGKEIAYRRMKSLPWVVEINVGEVVISNVKLTNHQMILTRVGVVVISLILLGFAICADVMYVRSKRKIYLKAKKKQERKAKRQLKKAKK